MDNKIQFGIYHKQNPINNFYIKQSANKALI